MFCSDDVSEVMHPSQPLLEPSLFEGQHFDTSAVKKALEVRRQHTYGVVVVDGDEATLGILQEPASFLRRGAKVTKIAHLSANIASRTRRGGQSALRYSRNRDGEELAFLRKVASIMSTEFGDIRGIVIGGRADMKRKLLAELSNSMQDHVARVVDLQCHANPDGLQQMTSHLEEVMAGNREQEVEAAVGRFMELLAQTETHEAPLACYGESQTVAALQLGAVSELLVAVTPSGLPWSQKKRLAELAAGSGASLVEVSPDTCARTRFCTGFKIGACLRYPVDPTLLDVEPTCSETCSVTALQEPAESALASCVSESSKPAVDSDCESNTTAPSEADTLFRKWLVGALMYSLQDVAAAESLAIGAELVLFDDTLAVEERLESAIDMLRGEGVSEDVLDELACHVSDHFDVEQQQ